MADPPSRSRPFSRSQQTQVTSWDMEVSMRTCLSRTAHSHSLLWHFQYCTEVGHFQYVQVNRKFSKRGYCLAVTLLLKTASGNVYQRYRTHSHRSNTCYLKMKCPSLTCFYYQILITWIAMSYSRALSTPGRNGIECDLGIYLPWWYRKEEITCAWSTGGIQ